MKIYECIFIESGPIALKLGSYIYIYIYMLNEKMRTFHSMKFSYFLCRFLFNI